VRPFAQGRSQRVDLLRCQSIDGVHVVVSAAGAESLSVSPAARWKSASPFLEVSARRRRQTKCTRTGAIWRP
jgi:hypothetical protein